MEEIRCPITMETIEFPKKLDCNHVFETHAIEQWLVDNNTCPVCRFTVYEKKKPENLVTTNITIEQLHELTMETLGFNIPTGLAPNWRDMISSVSIGFR